jgi:5'-3' exonuclease
MGIPNFLPDLEKTAGRLIDLREYPGRKIAIDVSVWIQRECHAQGDMLADEQHLSNFGRANLLLLQEEQQREEKEQQLAMQQLQQQQGSHDGDQQTDNTSHNNTTSQKETNEEIIQRYVQKVSHAVIDDLIRFRDATKSQVLVVFDGATPPVKYRTVATRKRKWGVEINERDRPVDATTDGESHNIHVERRYRANRRAGAGDHYGTVVDTIIHLLRQQHDLAFFVAPYEADGQLAFLQLHCHVDLVVTNDSDLLAYGPLSPVLYKIARDEQRNWTRGILLRRGDLGAILPGSKSNNQYSLLDWSPALLTVFFVACGGDYCRKLAGIGVKTVAALVRELFLTTTKVKTKTKHGIAKDDNCDDEDRDDDEVEQLDHPLGRLIQRLLTMTWDKTMTVAEKLQYEEDFIAAVFTYRHSIVYDPLQAKCCHLFPLDDHTTPDVELVDHRPYRELLLSHTAEARQRRREIIGPMLPPDLATYIAEGWICPKRMTLRPIPLSATGATTTTSDVPPPGVVAALQAYRNSNSGSPLRRQDGGNDDDETAMVVADGATTMTADTAMTALTAPQQNDYREDNNQHDDEAGRGSSCGDAPMEPPGTQLMVDDGQQQQSEEQEEILDADEDDDDNVMETQER